MGYLAKKKQKAATATGPIGFEVDDSICHTTGRLTAAAIIREAALDLNLKGKYSDINKSGRQPMLAGAFAGALRSVDTVLWIHETGSKTWEVGSATAHFPAALGHPGPFPAVGYRGPSRAPVALPEPPQPRSRCDTWA